MAIGCAKRETLIDECGPEVDDRDGIGGVLAPEGGEGEFWFFGSAESILVAAGAA